MTDRIPPDDPTVLSRHQRRVLSGILHAWIDGRSGDQLLVNMPVASGRTFLLAALRERGYPKPDAPWVAWAWSWALPFSSPLVRSHVTPASQAGGQILPEGLSLRLSVSDERPFVPTRFQEQIMDAFKVPPPVCGPVEEPVGGYSRKRITAGDFRPHYLHVPGVGYVRATTPETGWGDFQHGGLQAALTSADARLVKAERERDSARARERTALQALSEMRERRMLLRRERRVLREQIAEALSVMDRARHDLAMGFDTKNIASRLQLAVDALK